MVFKTIRVRQTDTAGNVSPASADFAFTLDTTAPVVSQSSITLASNNTKNNAYAKAGDVLTVTFTFAEAITFTPTTVPTTITIGTNARNLTTTHTSASGVYTVTGVYTVVSGDVDDADGLEIIIAPFTDVAGNAATGTGSNTETNITVDTTSPAAPIAINLVDASDTKRRFLTTDVVTDAILQNDEYTQGLSTFTFTGCAETDADIDFLNGGTTHTQTADTTKADGVTCNSTIKVFTFTVNNSVPTPPFSATNTGTGNTLAFRAEDAAGNQSPASATFLITLDGGVNKANTPSLVAASDSGIQGDDITNNKNPALQITAHENTSLVELFYKIAGVNSKVGEIAVPTSGSKNVELTLINRERHQRTLQRLGNWQMDYTKWLQ